MMSKKIKNPHDKYFRAVFSHQSIARNFLTAFLPKASILQLDLDSLDRITGSFVDEQLQEHYTDILFRCRLKNSENDIWISILLEHKSYNDTESDFQLLGYLHNGWQEDIKQGKKRRFILPILLYHGTEKWKRKSITNHFGYLPEHFIQFIPKFDYVLIDLSQFSEEKLRSMQLDAIVLNMAMILKFGRNEHYIVNHIDRIFYRAQEYFDINTGENFWNISFVYLLSIVDVSDKKITKIFDKLPKPIKSKAMTLYDSILKKGEEKGIQEGIQKGIQKGKIVGKQEGMQSTLKIFQLLQEGQSPEFIAQKLSINLDFVLEIKQLLTKRN